VHRKVTLPSKNVPLAECFNASKENGNDEDSEGALHAGVQAGGCAVGARRAKHRGGQPQGCEIHVICDNVSSHKTELV